MYRRRRFLQSLVFSPLAFLRAAASYAKPPKMAPQAASSGDLKLILKQINALRISPANAQATVSKMLAGTFPNAAERTQFLKADDGRRMGKTHAQNLADFVAFLKNKPPMTPLQWDDDLAVLSAFGGKPRNSFLTPEYAVGNLEANATKTLLWLILKGRTAQYEPIFTPGLRYGGAVIVGRRTFVTLSTQKGKAYFRTDEMAGKNAYDPRLDDAPPWVPALVLKEPNVVPFVSADGTMNVAWRTMSSKAVFITRFSSGGAKLWTKPVPGVDSRTYSVLMGFTEDTNGNLYVVRCREEADPPPEVTTPKNNPNNTFDRADVVKLTKLDNAEREQWTKNFAMKGGEASAFFSPLSARGKGAFSASSRVGFAFVKRATYRLAQNEAVVVPAQIAEDCLLGYRTDAKGTKSASWFDAKFRPTERDGIITSKVKLEFDDRFMEEGVVFCAARSEPGTPFATFNKDGGVQTFHELRFNPADYQPFVRWVGVNKGGKNKAQAVEANKLKLKATMEEIPLVFLFYGAATDYDPAIKGRHQSGFWRAVDARTGEPVENLNGSATGHSFDCRLLMTDEGIITAERTDNGLLLANYLQSRPYSVSLPVFRSQSDNNEAFVQLGGLVEADDGYLLLYTANNDKGDGSVALLPSEQAHLIQRDVGMLRVKKGFAQELDPLSESVNLRNPKIQALFLTPPKYLTNYYSSKQTYSSGRAKIVRVADGNYVVFWERWTDIVVIDAADGKKERSGDYDSAWAMKIDKEGNTVLPPVKISDTLRLVRGDDPVAWNGKAAFVTGDMVRDALVLHTIDANLKYAALSFPL